jgi:hypothetical protein
MPAREGENARGNCLAFCFPRNLADVEFLEQNVKGTKTRTDPQSIILLHDANQRI